MLIIILTSTEQTTIKQNKIYENGDKPVISTSIANTVSCNEKHKSSAVYSPRSIKPTARSCFV